MPSTLVYRRPLLKLSGEALMGTKGFGIDTAVLGRLAGDIQAGLAMGAELAVVVGGGNIYRGMQGATEHGMDRATGDYMGMLATVMNALAMQSALEQKGVPTRVLSAISMPAVCETYVRPKALHYLRAKRVVIFAAGTGNPFFTTDTTAALRAAEMGCDAILKATQVDGIYSADPKKDASATRFDTVTFTEVLARDLKVMDGAAIALARDNDIPVVVFSIDVPGNLQNVLAGTARATVVRGR
jgi:uridylate kinase